MEQNANNQATNPATEPATEPATNPATEPKETKQTQPGTDWAEQLDALLNKRLDGLAKSILKSNGVEDGDIGDIIKQYHASKAKATDDAKAEQDKLAEENKTLKAQILEGQIKTKSSELLGKVGANSKYLAQILKLADLNGVTADGKIDEGKLEAALKKVVDDCEAFKSAPEGTGTGFQNLGAKKNEPEAEDETARIRRVMGLPPLPKN